MHFQPNTIYHVYNRGNQQQNIFFTRENYIYFLEKIKKYILPRADILCWCLMPNHFHFLVYANDQSIHPVPKAAIPTQHLIEGIRLLLSSYTKGLQKQRGFKGNLFQQKTKAKALSENDAMYAVTAFHYIHQNPYRARLVSNIENWEFSSFIYTKKRNENLCNQELAIRLLDLDMERFYETSYKVISDKAIPMIFE